VDERRLHDSELVARCLGSRRDLQQAFRVLYERHAPSVLRFLRSMVGPDHANDCLQETFLRVYRDLERIDGARSFRGWVFGVARHVALDGIRGRARRPAGHLASEPPAAETAVTEATVREESRIVRQAIGRLPDGEREIFLLKQVEELTFKEIAEALGCSVRSAKYRMRSASERLIRVLGEQGLAPGGSS
jgi:RNA polymerase sigma-70 factor, ECF subfamily